MAQVGIYETYPMQVVPPHNHTTINEGNVLNIDNIINYNIANFSTQAFPDVPTIQSDHFNGLTLDPKWVPFQITGVITPTIARHHLLYSHNGEGALAWRGHFQPLPAGDFTILAKLDLISILSGGNDNHLALVLFEDAVANPNTCDLINFSINLATGIYYTAIQLYSNYQTWSAAYSNYVFTCYLPSYLRIRRTGTALSFDYSTDGTNWFPQWYIAIPPFAPAQMGICMLDYPNSVPARGLVDWFYYHPADILISPVGSSFK